MSNKLFLVGLASVTLTATTFSSNAYSQTMPPITLPGALFNVNSLILGLPTTLPSAAGVLSSSSTIGQSQIGSSTNASSAGVAAGSNGAGAASASGSMSTPSFAISFTEVRAGGNVGAATATGGSSTGVSFGLGGAAANATAGAETNGSGSVFVNTRINTSLSPNSSFGSALSIAGSMGYKF
jgi:hypothetical protein